MERRDLLTVGWCSAAVALLQGCVKKIPFPAQCRVAPEPKGLSGQPGLIVDAHCHIFNGSSTFQAIDTSRPTAHGLKPSEQFFGFNALEWLGLLKGKGRERILKFYSDNRIDVVKQPPRWMAKANARLSELGATPVT